MNVLIVEYPGYSIYKGEKSADAVLEDSVAVFDFLTENLKVEAENIIVFGRSIGSAPATYLCSERKPGALVLMSPFTSIRAVAENLVGTLIKYLVSERYFKTNF
jgi:acetyl esterase/lipase